MTPRPPSYSSRPGSAWPAPSRADKVRAAGRAPGAAGAKSCSLTRTSVAASDTRWPRAASFNKTTPPSSSMRPSTSDQGFTAGAAADSGGGAVCAARSQRSTIHCPRASRSTRTRGWASAIRPICTAWRAPSTRISSTSRRWRSARVRRSRSTLRMASTSEQSAATTQDNLAPSSPNRATWATQAPPFQASPASVSTTPESLGVNQALKYGAPHSSGRLRTESAVRPSCGVPAPAKARVAGTTAWAVPCLPSPSSGAIAMLPAHCMGAVAGKDRADACSTRSCTASLAPPGTLSSSHRSDPPCAANRARDSFHPPAAGSACCNLPADGGGEASAV